MAHRPANVRKAKSLGVKLPSTEGHAAPKVQSKLPVPAFAVGDGRVARFVYGPTAEGRYTVKMGRRPMGDFPNLAEAVGFAKWLSRKANRRAARGLGPKVRRVASAPYEPHMETLLDELSQVNGRAVRVSIP